jgi:hypothetical protein
MLSTKFRFIWPSGFRGAYSLEINQSETRIACGDHVCKRRPPQAILVSDWLISKKSSSLNPLCQMNHNLVESILGRSSIKDCAFSSHLLINPSGYRGAYSLEINQSETRIACGDHVCKRIGTK